MRGKAVFYPMGWDDNGLPTERRVQNYYGVRCDPSLPFDPGVRAAGRAAQGADLGVAAQLHRALRPPDPGGREGLRAAVAHPRAVDRLVDDLRDHRADARSACRSRCSCGWSPAVSPTSSRRRRCGTSTSRPPSPRPSSRTARCPARITASASRRTTARAVEIDTTRPELLPACVALVTHPDDARYRSLVGQHVTTPLFGARVPVVAHPLADPEKGTGIAMICTFGDLTDVTWWRELKLPVRAVIQANGTLGPVTWGSPGLGVGRPGGGAGRLRPARRPVGEEGPGQGGGAARGVGRPASARRGRSPTT